MNSDIFGNLRYRALAQHGGNMSDQIHAPVLTLQPPIFVHHLTGGVMMLIGNNRAAVLFVPSQHGPVMFSVPNGTPVLSLMTGQDPLRILGRTRVDSASDLRETVTSNFALPIFNAKAHPNVGTQSHCLADGQFQYWSGIAVALSKANRDADAMIASRVRSQIHVCLKRFERLSIAYRIALVHAVTEQTPSTANFTSGAYSHHLGSEYRSCINELYALRDAALAAAFRLRFGQPEAFTMKKIKSAVLVQQGGASALIAQSMFDAGGDLLIDRMSLYRSIALHCLGATNPVIGDIYQLRASTGVYGRVPYLVYPLYDDIEKMREIERGSSKGLFAPPDPQEVQRFLELPNHLDALEFCFDCFGRLLRICEALADEIGIEPEVTAITEDEILDITFTDESGLTKRYCRDEDTGKLVPY